MTFFEDAGTNASRASTSDSSLDMILGKSEFERASNEDTFETFLGATASS